MTAALLTIVTACGTAAGAGGGHVSPAAAGGASCVPGEVGPIGVSFVSANDGYLLGLTLKQCSVAASSKVVLRKTADGGLHWTSLSAPPAPWGGAGPDGHVPPGGVTSVLFADAADGWAYGPGLWATHDGGLTWHKVATDGRVVQDMAATGGHVVAVLLNCAEQDAGCPGPPSFTGAASPVAADAWRVIPGLTGQGVPSVTAQAGVAFVAPAGLLPPAGEDALLTGPADGSARWTRRPLPCRPGAIALSAVTARSLVLSCAILGAHPARTNLYSSADAGARWTRFAALGLYDGASTIQRTPDGKVLVAGMYDGVEVSGDGGRTWSRPAAIDNADATGGGNAIEADFFTGSDGYVIVAWGGLWLTHDAGRSWQRTIVR